MKTITFLSLIIALNIMISSPAIGQDIGKAAPVFSVKLLDGSTYNLSDHQGKVVVIFFLGNQCPNCVSAAPKIESEIYAKYSGRNDFSMVGIDTWAQSSARLPAFKSSTEVSFPLGVDGSSIASNYATSYDKLAVIDKDGILVHKTSSGGANGDIGNTVEEVNKALAKMATSIDDEINNKSVSLSQNYPNPASGKTTISFTLKEAGNVNLVVYDVTGKIISTLVSENKNIGEHEVSFNTTNLNSGIYYYQLKAGDVVQTRRMMVR